MDEATTPSTPELAVATEAAAAGGRILAGYFQAGLDTRQKTDGGLVTAADTESEQAIVDLIRTRYPSHVFLGEETHRGDVRAPHLWVIDPLDGTNNFVHEIPHFAVSIAYYRDGRPECGVVFNPVRDDWFIATRGHGAVHNGRRAVVATARGLDEVLVGTGFYYDRGALMRGTLAAIQDVFATGVHGVRRCGTASLDLCAVGLGQFGAFFEYQLAPWDFAAGCLFVEEAGGRVSDCHGAPLPLRSTSVLASNGHLHEPLRSVVAPHAP